MSLSFPISASQGDLFATGSSVQYIYEDGYWTVFKANAVRIPLADKAEVIKRSISSSYAATSSFIESASYVVSSSAVEFCNYAATSSYASSSVVSTKYVEYTSDTVGVDNFGSTVDGIFQIGVNQSTYKFVLKNVTSGSLSTTKKGGYHETSTATPTYNIDSTASTVVIASGQTTPLTSFTPSSLTGGLKEDCIVSFTYDGTFRKYHIKGYYDSTTTGIPKSMVVIDRLV